MVRIKQTLALSDQRYPKHVLAKPTLSATLNKDLNRAPDAKGLALCDSKKPKQIAEPEQPGPKAPKIKLQL